MGESEHLGGFIPLDGQSILPQLWLYLLDRYHPHTMLDIGGGEGWAALWFQGRKVESYCVDGSVEARDAGVISHERFVLHDFAESGLWERADGRLMSAHLAGYDLAHSVEFVEHVEERYLPRILEVFAKAKVVAMTAAWENAPGWHHVNCQNQPYWEEKLASIGFKLDEEATRESRALHQVQARDAYYGRTGQVYVRA